MNTYFGRAAVEPIIKMLVEQYPHAFFEDPTKRLPIRVSIDDLMNDGFPCARNLAEKALDWYHGHIGMSYNTIAGTPVYDLRGKIVGAITKEDEIIARQKINDMHEKINEKKRALAFAPAGTAPTRNVVKVVEKEVPPKVAPELSQLYAALMEVNKMFPAQRPIQKVMIGAAMNVISGEVESVIQGLSAA